MEHYFNLNGQFRAKYTEENADTIKLAINSALSEAFRKLEMANVISSTSSFMGPGWWFQFEEFNNNLQKEKPKRVSPFNI